MAYLCTLYDALVTKWNYSPNEVHYLIDDAIILLDFEETMPLYTYLWPSKCKVAWGAGELLNILVKHKMREDLMERTYKIGEKVAIYTFIDNQIPDGSWSCLHYPLSENIPEIKFSYKPLKGLVNVPISRIEGSKTIYLPNVEMTGEILGEMKSFEIGVNAYLNYLRGKND
jgi:hypothetical protein